MTTKLTAAQQKAMDTIAADGVLYSNNGFSIATIRVLHSLGLVDVEARMYRVWGATNRSHYRWESCWSARPKAGETATWTDTSRYH